MCNVFNLTCPPYVGSIDRKRKTDDNNHDVISGIDKKRKENDTDVTSGNF